MQLQHESSNSKLRIFGDQYSHERMNSSSIFNFIFTLFQNLLASHDIVVQRDYLPKLKDVPLEVDEDEETVKLVQLVKSQEPLVSRGIIKIY